MLFNSYEFIFLFLPATWLGFMLIGNYKPWYASIWLALASLFFYGWWNPNFVMLLLCTISFNFFVGRNLSITYAKRQFARNKISLVFGIAVNIATLFYFKYSNFFIDTINYTLDTDYHLAEVILPLGISFFTFTQIAFLVDSSKGIAKEFNFVYYCLFVTYFPHLIAGPVLHHKEMMPQFSNPSIFKPNYESLAVGLSVFFIGLFKKTMLADEMIQYVKPVFDSAAAGNPVSFKESWGAALSYSLQLYFDFSGYSDMAVGISKMFGVLLPLNFNSPYKAVNIIDFWRRWHMTLSRFLRDYLYIPLGGNRKGKVRRYTNLFITMLLGGLWHGAGWNFAIWGGLHGIYLVINHAWHHLRIYLGHDLNHPNLFWTLLARLLTFICVVFAWVFFRAETLDAALAISGAMLGFNGLTVTGHFQLSMIAQLLAIAWLLPNTQQLMSHHNVALSHHPSDSGANRLSWLNWKPNWFWLVYIYLLGFIALNQGGKISEFLYFRF